MFFIKAFSHNLEKAFFMRNKLNFCICICIVSAFLKIIYNTIKGPHWYAVQVSDTTMMTIASLCRGNNFFKNIYKKSWRFKKESYFCLTSLNKCFFRETI